MYSGGSAIPGVGNIFYQGTAFGYSNPPSQEARAFVYTPPRAKCAYCGQWNEEKSECPKCGAPIDSAKEERRQRYYYDGTGVPVEITSAKDADRVLLYGE